MAEKSENAGGPITIKKYANRRLYNTAKSSYVTLDHLAQMVREGQDFLVNDAKTGEDITRSVLAQIIFEEEAKGQTMLPANFLRQLIRLYGDTLQGFVPGYLEASMETFARNQEAMREQVRQAFEANPALANFEALARSNMEWFENALRMFAPFATGMGPKLGSPAKAPRKEVELEELKGNSPSCRSSSRSSSRKTEPSARLARFRLRRAAAARRPATGGHRDSPAGSRPRARAARRRRPRSPPAPRLSASRNAARPPSGIPPAPARRGPRHAFDEGAVDLDHVEAEVAEMLETGRAGTEVVQREGAAGLPHVVHEVDGLADVVRSPTIR